MTRRDYLNDPNAPKANSIVPSVTAIVTNPAGELLLVHKTDNNRWALPGGGMDPGESIARAAVRETKRKKPGSTSRPPESSACTPTQVTSSPTTTARCGSNARCASPPGCSAAH